MSTKIQNGESDCMHLQLKAIREQMRYSIREMAQELVLKPATYQGYESGRRKVPAYLLCIAKGSQKRVEAFSKRYAPGGEFDRIIAEVPMFMSEAIHE